MHPVLTVIISWLEWFALLTFPFVLIGYRYRDYVKKIVLLALLMSVISLGLHSFSLHLTLIIAIQMVVTFILVKKIFKIETLESLIISGIGYGFYSFIHIIIIELVLLLISNNYSEVILSNYLYIIQLTSFLIVILLSLLSSITKFQFFELYRLLRFNELNNFEKGIIYFNSFLTYFFICVSSFVLITDELKYRYTFVLISIIVLFSIILIYLILHSQFQKKRIVEAKKLYLDQESQISNYIEAIQKDFLDSFTVMQNLYERNSLELSKEFFQKQIFSKSLKRENKDVVIDEKLLEEDDLLYAFLVNKRKLSSLLGVSLNISVELKKHVPVTLKQLRVLGKIIDDLLFLLYQHTTSENKRVSLKIYSSNEKMNFEINSDFEFSNNIFYERINNSIIEFKNNNSTIKTQFSPLSLVISCERSI